MSDQVDISHAEDYDRCGHQQKDSVHVTILSTADFDAVVWTNKQHLAVGLAQSTDVLYLQSLGLRSPTFNRYDVARMVRRLLSSRATASTTAVPVPARVTIVSPKVLPYHANRLIRFVNRRLLNRHITSLLPATGSRRVLWTFSPVTYGIEKHFDTVVYHSVDLLHAIPGIPEGILLASESALLRSADHAIASSSGVQRHLEELGRTDVLLWENVAHTDLFRRSVGKRRPTAIFAGHLTPTKIDLDLLLAVARSGVQIVLAGPTSSDGTQGKQILDELLKHENVEYLGNLPLDRLAVEAGSSCVGLIPYQINPYTAGVFPMKVFEYLSAGLEVVATPIPSLANRDILGLQIRSGSDYADSVAAAIANFDEIAASARTVAAAKFSWNQRIGAALKLIESG